MYLIKARFSIDLIGDLLLPPIAMSSKVKGDWIWDHILTSWTVSYLYTYEYVEKRVEAYVLVFFFTKIMCLNLKMYLSFDHIQIFPLPASNCLCQYAWALFTDISHSVNHK